MYKLLIIAGLLMAQLLNSIEIDRLRVVLSSEESPFNYPLDPKVIKGTTDDEAVILCCHGYGGKNNLAEVIDSHRVVPSHLVAFNFPDYGISGQDDHKHVTFGTINELLPPLYLMKRIVIDGGAEAISLYGFSAGGGAVVNIIGVLNGSDYDSQLRAIGISRDDRVAMLRAVQRGVVLLDAPLKSVEEIASGRRGSKDLLAMAENYRQNDMRPIDSLRKWEGLRLSVVLFFQNPDEALTNRDDGLFASRLRQYNAGGRNKIIIADEGGHCGFHRSLWNAYLGFLPDKG